MAHEAPGRPVELARIKYSYSYTVCVVLSSSRSLVVPACSLIACHYSLVVAHDEKKTAVNSPARDTE